MRDYESVTYILLIIIFIILIHLFFFAHKLKALHIGNTHQLEHLESSFRELVRSTISEDDEWYHVHAVEDPLDEADESYQTANVSWYDEQHGTKSHEDASRRWSHSLHVDHAEELRKMLLSRCHEQQPLLERVAIMEWKFKGVQLFTSSWRTWNRWLNRMPTEPQILGSSKPYLVSLCWPKSFEQGCRLIVIFN